MSPCQAALKGATSETFVQRIFPSVNKGKNVYLSSRITYADCPGFPVYYPLRALLIYETLFNVLHNYSTVRRPL